MKNQSNQPATTFSKQIGRVTYRVQIFFDEDSKEDFNDKLLRAIKGDIANGLFDEVDGAG
ncbi:MAG: transposon-encoded TnpW family protein [Defluviitaleaceae bacterium]|nr:transposon-encoded TnpW family protein [Defluviitaleaceae bacterium]